MRGEKRLSPLEWAKQNPWRKGGKPCWFCALPEVEELNQAKRDGLTHGQIRRYIIEVLGKPEEEATVGRVDSHFSNGKHHEKAS